MKKTPLLITSMLCILFASVATAATDIMLESFGATAGSPLNYFLSGSQIYLTGNVKNVGSVTVSPYTIYYQEGAGPVISELVPSSALPGLPDYFTLSSPYFLPATTGDYTLKIWVAVPSDANPTNDTLTIIIHAVSYKPVKRLCMEEATGTWCGSCVFGIVAGDSVVKLHPDSIVLITVHHSDPMTVTAYDLFIDKYVPYYPSFILDRRTSSGPGNLSYPFNSMKEDFGFADISLSGGTISSGLMNVTVSVNPAINLSGNYRVALVITEDSVHSTATPGSWDQVNSASGSTSYYSVNGVDYTLLPDPIPAPQMYYRHVARYISDTAGDPGSLPSSMNAGTVYTHSYAAPVSSGWATNNLKVVALLIGPSGAILNCNTLSSTHTSLVRETATDMTGLQVYPNPANDMVRIGFELLQKSDISVTIIDAAGSTKINQQSNQMTQGHQQISIPVQQLPVGNYFITISSASNTITEKLVITR